MLSQLSHRCRDGREHGERVEPLDDFGYSHEDGCERVENWPSGGWPDVAKRYVEGDIALHVHIYGWTVEDAEPCDLCLTFECAIADANFLKALGNLIWSEVVETAPRDGAGQVDELVPVVVRQHIQEPERVVLRLTVPSLKRLLLLDDCLVVRAEKAHSSFDATRESPTVGVSEHVAVFEDRELDVVINDLIVYSRQLAGRVIERGSRLVEKLTDQPTTTRRRLPQPDGLDLQEPGCVEIVDNTVRFSFEEALDGSFQGFEMFPAPVNFVRDRVVGIGHEVESAYGQDAANSQGRRDSRPQAQGLSRESQERRQALNSKQPEEVASQTATAHRDGGCIATCTHSGSPKDA